MQIGTTLKTLGLLLMLYSLTMIPPIFVEHYYKDGALSTFYISLLLTISIGFTIWFPFRHYNQELRTGDGFLIVVLFWLALSLVGAFPFYYAPLPNISLVDSFFESVSGITTTGSTILTKIDDLPHAVLYFRQQTQFLGGIGIIILAVAILPMLGVGGMQLYRAEITGPMKDNKLTPKITETAKAIWFIYVVMTVFCALSYWAGGMSLFDAISFSFGTVSTGGFAPHDASMSFYTSPFLRLIATMFMFLAAVSFNLHFWALGSKKVGTYWTDPEFRLFCKIIALSFVIIWATMILQGQHHNSINMLLDVIFQVVSMCSTAGLAAADFSLWPSFIPLLLLFCGVIGGCSGSTSGGLKVMRVLLLQKQGAREFKRLVHPHGNFSITIGDKAVSSKIIEAIWGYLAIYIATFTILLLMLLVIEDDFYTAYTALIATFSNIGPGLGDVARNFANLSDYAKWILSFAMLLGRLEIFTALILFSPTFWRR